MIGRLHHIAYAVNDILKHFKSNIQPLFSNAELGQIFDDPIQRVQVAFVRRGGDPLVELVAPTHNESPVSRILERGRGGLYHVCYEVRDIDAEISRLRELRYVPLGIPVVAAALDHRRIVFLMSPNKDLFELLEGPEELFTP